jgi:hypothetical protein
MPLTWVVTLKFGMRSPNSWHASVCSSGSGQVKGTALPQLLVSRICRAKLALADLTERGIDIIRMTAAQSAQVAYCIHKVSKGGVPPPPMAFTCSTFIPVKEGKP